MIRREGEGLVRKENSKLIVIKWSSNCHYVDCKTECNLKCGNNLVGMAIRLE